MAGWNGSGSFSISYPDFVAGTTIVSTQVDTNNSDFVTGLNHCLTVNGETVPTATLPMANFRHTGVSNAAARDQYAAAGQVQDSAFHWVNAAGVTGTADAIALAPFPAIAAYAEGQVFRFKAEATSSSATPTVNVSSLGVKTIQNDGGALAVGDIVNGRIYEIVYDGTQFQLQNWAVSTSAAAASTSASGIIELATQAEVDTGTDAARAVVPSTLTGWTPGVASVTFDKANDDVLIRDASASYVLKRASLSTLALLTDRGMVLIQAQSPSTVASVNFTTGIDSTYNAYLIVGNLRPATDDVELWLRTDSSGGASFDAGASDYRYGAILIDTGGTSTLSASTATRMSIAGNAAASRSVGNDADQGVSFAIWMHSPSSTSLTKRFNYHSGFEQADEGAYGHVNGSGMRDSTSAVNAVQLLFESGNIAAGTVALYGVRAS